MPAKPAWYSRLPEILDALRATGSVPYVERETLERLFHVRRRRAHQLMSAFGGFQIGRTYLIDRGALIDALERIARGDPFSWEARRKAKLADVLNEAHQDFAGRQVKIPAYRHALPAWPAGVTLKRGELRIQFNDTEQLLKRLFELSQSILNNYDSFRHLAERPTLD